MTSGVIIWLKGLESYRLTDNDSYVDSTSLTSFISRKDSNKEIQSQIYRDLIETLCKNDSFTELTEGIIDVEIEGKPIRFVLKSLSRSEFYDYVINATGKNSIVIAKRPTGLSKKEAEAYLTEESKVTIDMPLPRPNNVFHMIKSQPWTSECVFNATARALAKFIYDVVVEITAITILRQF